MTGTIGSIGKPGDTLTQTNGALDATVNGTSGTLNLTDVKTLGTTINSTGSGETIDLTDPAAP